MSVTNLIISALVLALTFFAIGICIAALFLRNRFQASAIQQKAEFDSQLAILNERMSSRDAQLKESQLQNQTQSQIIDALQGQLRQESTLRASAEQHASGIPEIKQEVLNKQQEIAGLQHSLSELKVAYAGLRITLEEERKVANEKLALLEKAQVSLSDAFKALSSDALRSNNQAFLDLAKSTLEKFQVSAKGELEQRQQAIDQLVKPVRDSLEKFDQKIQDLEQKRAGAYEGLSQQVKGLLEVQSQLRTETSNLVRALGTPRVRGRWGEVQLKRVVELAGMLERCDFDQQVHSGGEEGSLRPDMIVHLPSGKNIVVDAKAPLAAYLEALEAADEDKRRFKFQEHARQVREHVTALCQKAYWDRFQPSPEFVVLFLPGEAFYSAALEYEPSLLELGVTQRVLIATPMTLIAMLRAVAYGWRQEVLAENAQQISNLGKEIYKRISDLGANFSELGSRLGKAVESYNKALGGLESRVLVSARRFRDLESHGGESEIEAVSSVDVVPRQIQASELLQNVEKIELQPELLKLEQQPVEEILEKSVETRPLAS